MIWDQTKATYGTNNNNYSYRLCWYDVKLPVNIRKDQP